MTAYLAGLPLWLSGMLIVGLSTAVAMCGPVIIRRRIGLERLVVNNEVAGFKYAIVGVIYAVLLAFAVIVVWEEFSESEKAAVDEAGAVANLYRLAGGLTPQAAKPLADELDRYLELVIREDWPAMEQGEASPAVTAVLNTLYAKVVARVRDDPALASILTEMFRQLDEITLERRLRLHLSQGIVPSVIWAALTIGAALVIMFSFFFGTNNLVEQVLMTGILTIVTTMGLFVILAIDHPFTGPIKVEPDALKVVLRDFGS